MAKQDRLTCLICNGVFPNREWLESAFLYEANEITEGWFSEFPGFVSIQLKIAEKQKEIKNLQSEIEYREENIRREAAFGEEQQKRETEYREGIKQREREDARRLKEYAYVLETGISPSGEGLKCLLSSDSS
jgi:hypothetical protein